LVDEKGLFLFLKERKVGHIISSFLGSYLLLLARETIFTITL